MDLCVVGAAKLPECASCTRLEVKEPAPQVLRCLEMRVACLSVADVCFLNCNLPMFSSEPGASSTSGLLNEGRLRLTWTNMGACRSLVLWPIQSGDTGLETACSAAAARSQAVAGRVEESRVDRALRTQFVSRTGAGARATARFPAAPPVWVPHWAFRDPQVTPLGCPLQCRRAHTFRP
jgi:hypothetical protein